MESRIESRTRRRFFEKRIVLLANSRYVLYRFFFPSHAERLMWLLKEGRGRSVPMQKFLCRTGSWYEAVYYCGYWVAASYEQGSPLLDAGTTTSVAALGRALARLHSIERSSAGPLFRLALTWGTYAQQLLRQLRRGLRSGGRPGHKETRFYYDWLQREGAFIKDLSGYQLTHGDIYGRNILVRDGDICLIDYELARFEPAGLELATALLRAFCGERPDLRHSLLQAYLETCPYPLACLWHKKAAFFLVAAALRLAERRQFRARRLARLGRSDETPRLQAEWYGRWARDMMDAHSAGQTVPESLLVLCQLK
jgi:Ser/Thr protein kinase RdoA (MazF antagonist)